jgi:hypothetical protein
MVVIEVGCDGSSHQRNSAKNRFLEYPDDCTLLSTRDVRHEANFHQLRLQASSKKKAIGMNSGLVCEIANRELTFAFF